MPGVIISNQFKNIKIIGRQGSGKLIQVSLHHKESFAETIGSELGIRVGVEKRESLLKDINCLQWIECRMEKSEKPITIVPVSLSNSKNTYARIASQDKWKKMGFSPSFFVTLLQ